MQADDREARLAAMHACTDYRGDLQAFRDTRIALAVQSSMDDAVLAVGQDVVLALWGGIGDWGALAESGGGGRGASAHALCRQLAEQDPQVLLPQLSGQFSLVVYDRRDGSLTVARDLGGTRPLYHAAAGDVVVLGAEVRQVLRGAHLAKRCDEEIVAQFLGLGFNVLDPDRTLHRGVLRLPAAAWRRWQDPGSGRQGDYWQPSVDAPRAFHEPEARAATLHALQQAVARSLPDRPYAISLSGGIDSSGVWALARRLEDVGVADPEQRVGASLTTPGLGCDETPLIRENLALHGGSWLEVDVAEERASQEMEVLADWLDAPPPGMLLGYRTFYAALRRRGLSVELSGHGGDDWFHRPWDFMPSLLVGLRWGDWRRCRAARGRPAGLRGEIGMLLRNALPRGATSFAGRLRRRPANGQELMHPRWHALAAEHLAADAALRRAADAQRWGALRAWRRVRAGLVIEGADALAARAGVQIRYPFLDGLFVRHAADLPDRIACSGPAYKHFLRESLRPVLPPGVRAAPPQTYEELHLRDRGWRDDARPLADWELFGRHLLDRDVFRQRLGQHGDAAESMVASHFYVWERILRNFDTD